MSLKNEASLPFAATFVAGAVAGVFEILIFYPLDVVKTRMQLATGATEGLVGSFGKIIREEGAARLYRGLIPPLLLEAPKRAVKFGANDFWGQTYLGLFGEPRMTRNLSILTGCCAGATESFVVVPFDLVKIRLQDKSSRYNGPVDVLKKVLRQEGLRGIYVGMESTFWRHIWFNGGFFGTLHEVRTLLPKAETPQARLYNNFVAGFVGGFVGTILNTPFDVVKSRIQGGSQVPGVASKYNWTYPALATIVREEGPGALYKGIVPKLVRFAPGGGVLLIVVEFTLELFRKVLPQ